MITQEQIKFLKNNTTPYGLLSEDEKNLYYEIKEEFIQVYDIYDREWLSCNRIFIFDNNTVYRLSPNYELEEENLFQWVYKNNLDQFNVSFFMTEKQILSNELLSSYGKYVDVVNRDGSLDLSKMKKVGE